MCPWACYVGGPTRKASHVGRRKFSGYWLVLRPLWLLWRWQEGVPKGGVLRDTSLKCKESVARARDPGAGITAATDLPG